MESGAIKILLVEDEANSRELARLVLAENGYQVFTAGDAREAMTLFEKEKGNFHLVFSDVFLPDRSCLGMVEEMLACKPELQVLLCSGYVEQDSLWPVIRDKKFPFLQKPYGLTDLLKTVEGLIGKSQSAQG